MPAYQWTCQVCARSNESTFNFCPVCGCPAEVSGREIEARKAAVSEGALFLSPASMPTGTLSLRYLCAGSIYKFWLLGLLCSLVPISVLFGVFGLFGFDTVTVNGLPVHGVLALLISPLFGVMVSAITTAVLGTISLVGFWLYFKKWRFSITARDIVAHHS